MAVFSLLEPLCSWPGTRAAQLRRDAVAELLCDVLAILGSAPPPFVPRRRRRLCGAAGD
jgi:hypothetical protein